MLCGYVLDKFIINLIIRCAYNEVWHLSPRAGPIPTVVLFQGGGVPRALEDIESDVGGNDGHDLHPHHGRVSNRRDAPFRMRLVYGGSGVSFIILWS